MVARDWISSSSLPGNLVNCGYPLYLKKCTMAGLLLTGLGLLAILGACGARRPPATVDRLLSLTNNPGGRPDDAPADFDCAWRAYAAQYALAIQPSLSAAKQRMVRDALQIATLCNTTGDGADWIPQETRRGIEGVAGAAAAHG